MKNLETELRIKKLPQWAQQHIETLQRELVEAEKRSAVAWQAEEPEGPCIQRTIFSADPYRHEFLPIRSYEKFLVGGVEVSLRDGACSVTTTDGRLLVIHPVCGNVVTVEPVER